MKESDLYPPLKTYLEAQGYEVKAEIGACDLMARRGDEPPVIVEMKLTFSLALVMQGVARQAMFDHVYLAVPVSAERGWKLRYRDIIRLCRRLGLGLLAVRTGEGAGVEAHLDPGPYAPRKNLAQAGRLLREFDRRVGDPNLGGVTGVTRMTAYRQDALRCAMILETAGPARAAVVAKASGVARAGTLMRDDHYGWFERVARGTYALTPKGVTALIGAHRATLGALIATPSVALPPDPA
ncbi:MAG: hypothetical protein GC186_00395 [Rhodobacteraceae bacterium]|nr:hypothetical protein [Paracoccaceae bacterium]